MGAELFTNKHHAEARWAGNSGEAGAAVLAHGIVGGSGRAAHRTIQGFGWHLGPFVTSKQSPEYPPSAGSGNYILGLNLYFPQLPPGAKIVKTERRP
jgi:hypothetical protein